MADRSTAGRGREKSCHPLCFRGETRVWSRYISSFAVVVLISFYRCIIFNIIHIVAVQRYTSSSDAGIDVINVLVWQNAQLGWAILAAAAPSMLFLRKSYEETWTSTDMPGIFGNGGSGNRSNGYSGSRGYAMGPVRNKTQPRTQDPSPAATAPAGSWGARVSTCDSDASLIEGAAQPEYIPGEAR